MRILHHLQWRCIPTLLSGLLITFGSTGVHAQCIPAPEGIILCLGDTIELNGQPQGSGIYILHEWTDLGTGSAQNIQLSNLNSQVLQIDAADPDAQAGSLVLQYQATDDQGCVGTALVEVEIGACPDPVISLLSPCTPRETQPGSQGNATTLDNGQFQETIQVESAENESWYLVAAPGFYDAQSPQPPANPIPFALGPGGTKLLEETPGVYTLKGIHVDALGYEVVVSNGIHELSVANNCTYPNPGILSLAAAYCDDSSPVTLQADNGGALGDGQFDILSADGQTVLVPDVSVFFPTGLPLGGYQVRYTFDENPNISPCEYCAPGAVQAVTQFVEIVEEDLDISCNSQVQIALGPDCQVEVTPDMVLEGNYNSYGVFIVELYNGNNLISNVIGGDQVGLELDVQVINTCNGNYCWGLISVVDKLDPVFDCPTEPLQISCLIDPETVLPPLVTDNCDLILSPNLNSETVESFDCDAESSLLKTITRYWGAADASGNQAEVCAQVIEVIQPSLAEVVFPPNRDGIDGPIVDCSDGNINPAVTGYPTVNGLPLEAGNACNFNVLYEDISFGACGNTFKILRTWLVYDWCSPSVPGVNPLEVTQLIKVGDQTPPDLTCPLPSIVSVNQEDCTATFLLPEATFEDDCSAVTVQVISSAGVINGNGGMLYDLPIGVYEIEYLASDACFNTSHCFTQVEVTDAVAPVAICDEFTVTSLDLYGEIALPAGDLDDGSYDACTDVAFGIKRMGDPGAFLPELLLNCADVENSPVLVVLEVRDEYGNANTCMVEVTVQDKLPPLVECPDDLILECVVDISNLNLTGTVSVVEPCAYEIEFFDNQEELDICGLGTAYRQFVVTDASGNTATCTQIIKLEDSDLFSLEDIEWPEDFEASECISPVILHPDSLPSTPINYSRPVFADNPCGLVAWSYEDAFFEIASPACFKIVRTWRVIDWCHYDPLNGIETGFWEYDQVIKVVDNTSPIMDCNFYPFVKLQTPVCNADTIWLEYPAIIDCSPDVEVTVTSTLGDGFGPFLNVPMGDYLITYTATDNCGNMTVCSYVMEVVDAKAPSPVCVNGIVVELDSIGVVPIYASWFNQASTDNCTAPEDLLISFSYNPNDTIIYLTCDNVGAIHIQLWVTDEAGNQDFCTFLVFVQDNFNVCPGTPAPLTVAGLIATENALALPDVNIGVSNAVAPPETTNNDGTYELLLDAGGDYTIVPQLDLNLLDGVTTYDLALITMHILNVQILDSPYKIIAADINRSNAVTTLDVVALQKLILLVDSELPNGNTSWRFVEADYVFPTPANPFAEVFPEIFSVNNLAADIWDADFVAVKVGDVNGTATGGAQTGAQSRSDLPVLPVQVTDRFLRAGERVRIPVALAEASGLLGFQWAFKVDPQEGFVQGAGSLEGLENIEYGHLPNGYLTLSAFGSEPAAEVLFELELESRQDTWLSAFLEIDYQQMAAEVYDATGSVFQPQLQVLPAPEESGLQIIPNPSTGKVLIVLDLLQAGPVNLQLLDASGQAIYRQVYALEAGPQSIELAPVHFPGAGLYFCKLEAGDEVWISKIVRIQ